MNREGRATSPQVTSPVETTASPAHGNPVREVSLLFEEGSREQTGVDLPSPPAVTLRLGKLKPREAIGLAGLSEPQTVRHYTRLSQQNYGIDTTFYPLGSCTMKHNPRLNEKMARLSGFAAAHPLQPLPTVQGALKVMEELSDWLLTLTGMQAVALSPGAGAHGEFCGMAAIRAALRARGDAPRRIVLVPESAHGTNPATAAALGFIVETIPANAEGRVDLAAFQKKLTAEVAAIMLTNPNTCGLFERDIVAISKAVHDAGAYFYCDGANFNAIVGRVRPADLGIDAMHINLHKTFSTPHGGGGPGSGPVVLSKALAPYAPLPFVVRDGEKLALIESRAEAEARGHQPFGRLKAFHGQMGMFTRALTYCLSHGADGLRQASSDAVLNANYLLARLKETCSAPFAGPCMHEALFDDRFLHGTGVSTLDLAKGLLDAGFHPMTMYFPLVVHGAMLIEPTESETKATLDAFVDALTALVARAKTGDAEDLKTAPHTTFRRRLDETRAARTPVLRWRALEKAAPGTQDEAPKKAVGEG